MAFDPELGLVYVGTGNGSPWPRFQRSPAGGDNLYLSSILALDIDTGRMRWHYQTTPGDSWDYTATQHIVLAHIDWQGEARRVLFQAPKNGFFYVIDRVTGELLAADKYVRVSWASHVDPASGRPVLSDTADYSERSSIVFPATLGGHNWHPMSYSDRTGLVYIPAQDGATYFAPDKFSVMTEIAHSENVEQVVPEPWIGFSILVAWNPLSRGIEWMQPYPSFGNAGVLSTAGGFVIQGDAQGNLNFYDDRDGTHLRRLATGTGIIAPPVTYLLDGEQYIAIAAGWGGAMFVLAEQNVAARQFRNDGRLIVLKLDGGEVPLPEKVRARDPRPAGPQVVALGEEAARGKATYIAHCGGCHGWFGQTGLLPDLRRTNDAILENLEAIVFDGALVQRGMPSFKEKLSTSDLLDLKAYLRAVRRE